MALLSDLWVEPTFIWPALLPTAKSTNQFSALSQRFLEYGLFAGRGDSTKVFVELGFFKRANDSLQNGMIQRVNNSQTFALRSKLIQTKKSDLTLFANSTPLTHYV